MNRFKTWVQFFLLFFRNFILALRGIISNPLQKSFLWLALTLLFGLLQSWLVLGKSMILMTVDFSQELDELFMSGALLFFSTAIVASLTIDYFLLRKADFPKSVVGSNFVFFPAILLIFSISIFMMIDFKKDDIDFEVLRATELAILTATCVYAIHVKMKLFIADHQNEEEQ